MSREQLVMRRDAWGARGCHAEEPEATMHLRADDRGHEQRLVPRVSVGTPDRVGGRVSPAVLPHHRTYGSVYGGS